MFKKALDQERAASADMRRSLLGAWTGLPKVQDATPSVSAPTAEVATSTSQTDPDAAGLAAGYPDLGGGLTQRQHQILGLVLAGHPSKNIAAILASADAPWKTTAPPSCSAPGHVTASSGLACDWRGRRRRLSPLTEAATARPALSLSQRPSATGFRPQAARHPLGTAAAKATPA